MRNKKIKYRGRGMGRERKIKRTKEEKKVRTKHRMNERRL